MALALHQQRKLTDPTRTVTLRRRYAQAIRRRFRTLATDIRQSVMDHDAFGLRPGPTILQPARPGEFDEPTQDARLDAFLLWLRLRLSRDVLEVVLGPDGRVVARNEWQTRYVRAAYARALGDTRREMRRTGRSVPDIEGTDLMQTPAHVETLALLVRRNEEGLRGVTEAVATGAASEVAAGIVAQVRAEDLAGRLLQVVRRIGENRGRQLAQTEVIRAYAEGTLTELASLGIEQVEAQVARWTTARDHRVCRQCKALEGRVYTIQDAHGILPLHTTCRCRWTWVESQDAQQDTADRRQRRATRIRRRQRVAG